MTENRKTLLAAAALALLVLAVFAFFYSRQPHASEPSEPLTATAYKLNTVVTITLYDSRDQAVLDGAMELCDEYERIFSRTLPESELYRLNAGTLPQEDGAYILSDPLADLVGQGLSYSELSDGAFDITIGPVSSLWDFTSGTALLPDEEELSQALALVDYRQVSLEGNLLRFGMEGMQLDLGAIAKGYIADRMKDYLIEEGVGSAIIDLGGNILCLGTRPDGALFRIGIQRPFAERSETAAIAQIDGKSVVSSGIYERFFEKEGKLYHHLLNPRTGYPYENGLTSVTILSDLSVDGDGLSTSCFALGLEEGMKLAESLPGVFRLKTGTGQARRPLARPYRAKCRRMEPFIFPRAGIRFLHSSLSVRFLPTQSSSREMTSPEAAPQAPADSPS